MENNLDTLYEVDYKIFVFKVKKKVLIVPCLVRNLDLESPSLNFFALLSFEV